MILIGSLRKTRTLQHLNSTTIIINIKFCGNNFDLNKQTRERID